VERGVEEKRSGGKEEWERGVKKERRDVLCHHRIFCYGK
jgi:hypothetical protein